MTPAVNINGMTGTISKPSEVSAAIHNLADNTNLLAECIAELKERLAPISLGDSRIQEKDGVPSPVKCKISQELHDTSDRIEKLRYEVRDMIENLQI